MSWTLMIIPPAIDVVCSRENACNVCNRWTEDQWQIFIDWQDNQTQSVPSSSFSSAPCLDILTTACTSVHWQTRGMPRPFLPLMLQFLASKTLRIMCGSTRASGLVFTQNLERGVTSTSINLIMPREDFIHGSHGEPQNSFFRNFPYHPQHVFIPDSVRHLDHYSYYWDSSRPVPWSKDSDLLSGSGSPPSQFLHSSSPDGFSDQDLPISRSLPWLKGAT